MAVYSQADLDALDVAISSKGAIKKVRIEDREVEFRDVSEMLEIRRHIERQLRNKKRSALGRRHTFAFKKAIE
ncbi:hypothetical protein Bb109J_c1963 [Bdellovibrio bacteriovorus]|uniref:phage head-tail joining protein n=1 Tax=Bdellovibrio bacteriovorus TaxID=959 RepID=UPI00045BE1C5|nr:hypothetical protein [Bdellovibrio bacteriovorus]AHZ84652.1 hypothetical protein EP01_06840 [Bdellovibrio bacteriovorus]BEV68543.1 hypothetical protein Bb109J_c1963 [Bdellovibrio bacteriovorus]